VNAGDGAREVSGVVTAPDARHAIDAEGVGVLVVFVDPESAVGRSLRATLAGPVRAITPAERDAIDAETDPIAIMGAHGVAWTERAARVLGAPTVSSPRGVHPRVTKLLRHLRTLSPRDDDSLEALARVVDLSPSRLMHAFTTSIGTPLRPYLLWLRLQRAAAVIVTGAALSEAAHAAGFADAAHMTRTFRRMLGVTPSTLRGGDR
jgi:AraC-like DNA-binding protein